MDDAERFLSPRMRRPIPRGSRNIGTVARFLADRGWDATVRGALSALYPPERALDIGLRLGVIPVYLQGAIKASGGLFRWNVSDHEAVGIFMNPQMLTRPELRQAFLHEVAHAINALAGERVDHGADWRGAMEALGLPAELTHHADFSRWGGLCPACGKTVARRVKRPREGLFYHAPCGTEAGTLTWYRLGVEKKS